MRRRLKSACAALVLVLGLSGATSAFAQDVLATSGDWEYGSDAELAAASTRNGQGWLFGLVCSPNCIGFVESDQPCEQGRRYDGRMISARGTDAVPLECRHLEGRYALLFTPTEAFIDMLGSGPEVTVSVPLRPEAATDFRFSLNGAHDAVLIALATAIARSGSGSAPPAGTGGSTPPST